MIGKVDAVWQATVTELPYFIAIFTHCRSIFQCHLVCSLLNRNLVTNLNNCVTDNMAINYTFALSCSSKVFSYSS
jgi:hypothetical protein